MKIFLIGFMGSGKTFVGKQLAAQLDIGFFDTDDMLEKHVGLTIPDIFKQFGEQVFRQMEQQILQGTSHLEYCIISTGGGLPCFDGNMQWMNENGLTIYLKTTPELIFQRLAVSAATRPLIADYDQEQLKQFISEKMTERSVFYAHAHLVYEQTATSEAQITEELRDYLKRFIW